MVAVLGDQLLKLARKEENIEKAHDWLRGGITKSRYLPKQHSRHSRLRISTGDAVVIVTPESDSFKSNQVMHTTDRQTLRRR